MARALRAWAKNRGGKNSVRNLRYGPRTRLVRGMSSSHVYQKTLSCLSFSSIGGHSEQESTLNQLLVEMDGELYTLFTVDLVLLTGFIM